MTRAFVVACRRWVEVPVDMVSLGLLVRTSNPRP